jgi:deoxyribonuclease I
VRRRRRRTVQRIRPVRISRPPRSQRGNVLALLFAGALAVSSCSNVPVPEEPLGSISAARNGTLVIGSRSGSESASQALSTKNEPATEQEKTHAQNASPNRRTVQSASRSGGFGAELPAGAGGNHTRESYLEAKRLLEREVYFDHRVTIYCGYRFSADKKIDLPADFRAPDYPARAKRVEWEHAVPAENFGRAFRAWRGDAACVDEKGEPFKGRKCAETVSPAYRLMQADMFNLFPSVGAVNAVRSNYRYAELPGVKPLFGGCEMKVQGRKAEPPDRAKGQVARATLYMEESYRPVFHLSDSQRRLMKSWSERFPVDQWECTRAARIAALQGNENRIVAEACRAAGLRYKP